MYVHGYHSDNMLYTQHTAAVRELWNSPITTTDGRWKNGWRERKRERPREQ